MNNNVSKTPLNQKGRFSVPRIPQKKQTHLQKPSHTHHNHKQLHQLLHIPLHSHFLPLPPHPDSSPPLKHRNNKRAVLRQKRLCSFNGLLVLLPTREDDGGDDADDGEEEGVVFC